MSVTTCKRHPREETLLRCSTCEDPICAQCAVPSAVGQKCPLCARQSRSARAGGKPRQYVKASLAGTAAALVLAVALFVFIREVGILTLIASGFAGYGIARAVHWGAEGNAAPPFRIGAITLSLAATFAAWYALGVPVPQGFAILSYPAAAYGAWIVYR